MSATLDQLPARDPDSELLNVVVDTPKGSRNKYKYDSKAQIWKLSKILPLGMSFPFDFGFVPSTKGQDGDPVDVLVLSEEAAFPGCVLPALLIGVIEAEQTDGGETIRNDRLIAVIKTAHNPPIAHSLEEVGEQRLREIERFFVSYNQTEGREFRPLRRGNAKEANALLDGTLK
jgi:inorganic pyrophosphatase